MSLNEADLNIYIPGVGASVTFALCILVSIYFVSSKLLAGANFIISDYKHKKDVDARYKSLFATRENLLYHITRAKARGDLSQATEMMFDLENLDKRIDLLEESNQECFKKGYFNDGKDERKLKV